MKFTTTTTLNKILNLKKRVKIIQGGTSSAKTISILLILIDIAQSHKDKTISVVSESFPHLRRGAIKDFLEIMEGHGYYKDELWSKTDFTYRFETGSKIEFFSADSPDKVRGPRRDILFINEANNISFDTYTQLAIRTDGDIYLDYNPVSEFWVNTEILNKQDNDYIIVTYKDNEALSKTIVDEIESRKDNKYFWQVYGLGLLSDHEGKIYRDWQIIDEIPHEAKLERYGVDFGYSNDPTAIIALYYYNGGYIVDEITYQKGLSNKQIADILLNKEKQLVIADSAEPKSIDEINSYGIPISGAEKGKDSVSHSIQMVQEQRISMTSRSLNVIREYRNYLWQTDKQGKVLNIPEDHFKHSMDAIAYALTSLQPIKRRLENEKIIKNREMKAILAQFDFNKKKKFNR
jgi:phage terminase large subunit